MGPEAGTEECKLLRDKLECTELVYRLARGLDRCDAELLRSVFHPDATDDHGGFKGSADQFIAWALGILATMERTQHAISNVLVELCGDEARAESYFVANHDMTAEGGTPARMIAAGRYLDRFERREGIWKIAHRQTVYDWNAWEPRTDKWDRSPGSPRIFGQRGTGDASYQHFFSTAEQPLRRQEEKAA